MADGDPVKEIFLTFKNFLMDGPLPARGMWIARLSLEPIKQMLPMYDGTPSSGRFLSDIINEKLLKPLVSSFEYNKFTSIVVPSDGYKRDCRNVTVPVIPEVPCPRNVAKAVMTSSKASIRAHATGLDFSSKSTSERPNILSGPLKDRFLSNMFPVVFFKWPCLPVRSPTAQTFDFLQSVA